MGLERRGRVRWSCFAEQLDDRMTSIDTTNKPFMIEKRQVYEAYKAVKSNKGVAGVDGQTIEQFEADLGGNLSIGTQTGPLSASKRDPFRCGIDEANDVSLFG